MGERIPVHRFCWLRPSQSDLESIIVGHVSREHDTHVIRGKQGVGRIMGTLEHGIFEYKHA